MTPERALTPPGVTGGRRAEERRLNELLTSEKEGIVTVGLVFWRLREDSSHSIEVVRETRVGEEALVRDFVDLGWAVDHFLGEVVLER